MHVPRHEHDSEVVGGRTVLSHVMLNCYATEGVAEDEAPQRHTQGPVVTTK